MKSRYNIGDRVKIKHILASESSKYIFGINPKMERFSGQFITISKILNTDSSNCRFIIYKMKEDNCEWSWSISMFDTSSMERFINLNEI